MKDLCVFVPERFRQTIHVVYPPNNFTIFEEWFHKQWVINNPKLGIERIYLPIYWTAYYVNHKYGQDMYALNQLQLFIDSLDKSKKYFTIIQYDDGILNDISGVDLYQFNMSQQFDYPLPLIGMPHPYTFPNEPKKYLANFIGNITHPIREHAKTLIGKEGYYISFDRHSPEDYCRIIAQSHFTLCYRGYGLNSFRIAEALQYGSIPVYISDKFTKPHNVSFSTYGVCINEYEINDTESVLAWLRDSYKLKELKSASYFYNFIYTYEGTKNKILNHLKNI